jgi:nucleoid-associated protein YgaU
MREFDLYRITMAYLGVIFVLCAMVVFNPLGWLWPAGEPLVVQELATPMSAAPGGENLLATSALPAGKPAGGVVTANMAQKPATPDGLVDPAEIVASLVAQSFGAQFGEVLGEGDISAQVDAALNLEDAMVASGSDVAYTVGIGDSLGSLALRFYGDSTLSSVIFEANRGLMASPDQLRLGQVLIIPGKSPGPDLTFGP